jgi:catechol 2,3-dioxygenase-like lactoylglutathione lyase family enzyme
VKVSGITPILNVSDVPASLAWFEKLGWKRCWTYNAGGSIAGAADSDARGPANFAATSSGSTQIFLCRDGQGSRGERMPKHAYDEDTGGVWMSWWVGSPAEVDAAYRLALEQGVVVVRPPEDEPWGCRECHIRHPDGHTFRISAGLEDED